MCLYAFRFALTFARCHTLKPPVINISVAGISAVLKPSTVRSATTVPAGFLERPAFGARHRFSDSRGDGWRAD